MEIETPPPMQTPPEPAAPRVVHVLSEEENIASCAYYVEPLEQNSITKITSWASINSDEHRNYSRQSFYLMFSNRFSEQMNWPLLWEVGVPEGSLEIRILMSESFTSMYRLIRHGGEWQGFHASSNFKLYNIIHYGDDHVWTAEVVTDKYNDTYPIFQLTPRTDWESLWGKLENLGILTLPELHTPSGLDTSLYIVEINDGGRYRSYRFSDLENDKEPEARKFIDIINTLRGEFRNSFPIINVRME